MEGLLIDPRALLFSWTGHIQDPNVIPCQPLRNGFRAWAISKIENKARLTQALCHVDRESGPLRGLPSRQDESSVGIAGVPFRTLRVFTGRGFLQGISGCDRAVFGSSSLGTPAATGNAELNRRIKGSSIHARLASAHEFLQNKHEVFRVSSLMDPCKGFQACPARFCILEIGAFNYRSEAVH